MMGSKVYADLNIPNGPMTQKICEEAIKLGYKILAINTPFLAKNLQGSGNHGAGQGQSSSAGKLSKKAAKKRKFEERANEILTSSSTATSSLLNQTTIPNPISSDSDWINKLESEHKNVRVLQRLTIIFDEVKYLNAVLNHECVKMFDILAVLPTNHDALVACITTTPHSFDIISFDFNGPYWIDKIKINRVKGSLAASKDIFFEINYAAAFHGDNSLENLIFTTHQLLEEVCVKAIKNIIISSGAMSELELRSPKDATTLAFLTGIDETTARHCILDYPTRIIIKADTRKFGKSWVAFIPNKRKSLPEEEEISHSPSSTEIFDSQISKN